jgi:hypothetical protein
MPEWQFTQFKEHTKMKYLLPIFLLITSGLIAAPTVSVVPTSGAFTVQPVSPLTETTGQLIVGALNGTTPGTGPSTTATTVVSTALEASHVLKASSGYLVSVSIFNSKGSAQFILIMNSATVPADGAVTLLFPPIPIPANTTVMIAFPVPLTASTGIAISNSSTGTFTKTIGSADCAFVAQVQ